MEDIVETFFSKGYEKKINENILYYKFPESEVREYARNIIREPLSSYVSYVLNDSVKEQVISKDVVQFSNWDDATINICRKLKDINNPGVNFFDAGKLLLDDGKDRKDTAVIKYGENHIKTCAEIGLAFQYYKTYYLSGIGYIYVGMEAQDREKLITRLIIRSKLIKRLIQTTKLGNVELRDFLYMLSDSTYLRRRSNMKNMVDILYHAEDPDLNILIERIQF